MVGRKTFLAGAWGLVLFGGFHLLPVYRSNFVPPENAAEQTVQRALKDLRVKLGPFEPSAWGAVQILNASYSLLLIYAGTINLVVYRAVAAQGRLGMLTACNVGFVGGLIGVALLFQFPPPMLFSAVALLCFVVSLVIQRRTRQRRNATTKP